LACESTAAFGELTPLGHARIVSRRQVPFMTYRNAIEYLYGLRLFGAKFGLENTLKLAALAGHPHERLRSIHVAGTNGKGSTCAMLEGIYRQAGLRVGLFTSPHLVHFSERIQVNRTPISEADVIRLVNEFRSLLGEFPTEAHPTFFEVVLVMALHYFVEQKCELVILETGLGGRLDATNIVTPLASVITNVQFDHQRWLGHSIGAIAAEKAGIIKPGVPVITGASEPEALPVIQDTARRLRCPLTQVTAEHTQHPPVSEMELPLLGWHQKFNAAVAVATVEALQEQLPVSDAALRKGLASVHWPGRLQLVVRPSGQKLLLDGAHNPAGAATLCAALAEHFPHQKPALILGILDDKDWHLMCEILAPAASRVVCVPLNSDHTMSPATLAAACRRVNPSAETDICDSVRQALQALSDAPFVLIAVSLYLIGEALEELHLAAPAATDEKGLNEWRAASCRRH
jgi:dihydrofolate synthase/folylpolyglutamate synthase